MREEDIWECKDPQRSKPSNLNVKLTSSLIDGRTTCVQGNTAGSLIKPAIAKEKYSVNISVAAQPRKEQSWKPRTVKLK